MTASNQALTLEQVAELRAAGLRELYGIRSKAMKQVIEELQSILPGTQQAHGTPPPWKLTPRHLGLTDEPSINSPKAWELFRAHLAARTAIHMAAMGIGDGVTGYSMARHIGADLQALALDGWEEALESCAGITGNSLSTIGGCCHV